MDLLKAAGGLAKRMSTDWLTIKNFLEYRITFDPDALHPIAGVLLQLAASAAFKWPLGRVLPWLLVFVLEIINEASDIYVDPWPDPVSQIGEGFTDILLTMVLPTLLLLFARTFPERISARKIS